MLTESCTEVKIDVCIWPDILTKEPPDLQNRVDIATHNKIRKSRKWRGVCLRDRRIRYKTYTLHVENIGLCVRTKTCVGMSGDQHNIIVPIVARQERLLHRRGQDCCEVKGKKW
jgi:hypothetical protein